jgi:putative transposase
MVTGATYQKELFFKEAIELDLLQDLLLKLAENYRWCLEAWAIFANHYHFIAQSPENPQSLRRFITHFHAMSAKMLNQLQNSPGRRVWYQYWDSRITFQNSYLARLNYVIQNPVKHKVVSCANQYKWCSASWFENNATPAYFKAVTSFKIDSINVIDDF